MPSIEIECYCDLCGSLLDAVEIKGEFVIEPCNRCLRNAETTGYDEGYEDGAAKV